MLAALLACSGTLLRPSLRVAGAPGHTRPALRTADARMVAAEASAVARAVAPAARMPHTWVPLASDYELDPERPTPVRFLDKRYVIWRDNGGTWRVMDDACAHRLAPLSEGRIDRESGGLECAYHGWQFGGCGSCTRIPQAHGEQAARACASPRSAVRSYPTQVEKAVVWFWPWEEAAPSDELSASPQHMVEPVASDAATYTRDLPCAWEALDPSTSRTARCLLSAVCCLLSAVCCLLSAVGCRLSAVCCRLSAVGWLSAARCPLPAARCPLPAARCPLAACCVLLTAGCRLLAACCVLLTAGCRLPAAGYLHPADYWPLMTWQTAGTRSSKT
jgi:nitrite reductase/ring-hydroxylating ferredoxin subunit